ncbi:hypothetical protein QTP70_009992 [Hemibagrus guttatus]|uniref:Ig-like domain-containing protein n=1 Tax=Hemibagrus guttatus TaxID=175788 RepID=A0AAE0Q5Z5_9TELE|nr:hypothetical protein QTP70_009992 [Hemibagrus guttatus]
MGNRASPGMWRSNGLLVHSKSRAGVIDMEILVSFMYLKGDLSLTITEAYYSMRGSYCCMCKDKCMSEYYVSVETENFSVQLKPGEDLLMDLPRTEPVEVFYKSSRSFAGDAAGKNICTLVDGSVECVDAYTHRMSSVLKLEHVNLTDCGVYTIQSQTSHEVFLTYNVSVKGAAMQFYSLHHCVLLFLILTFTTAPTLAYTSVMVKLDQSAVLPCEQNCSGSLRWIVIDKPGSVAQCNQTSCWPETGFNISHDQYLKGDLSLTITAADYSNRGLYTCQCDDSVALQVKVKRLGSTSCWSKKGFNISHDQYLKGDLSLTITEAYYSMRGSYCCMCDVKCMSEYYVSVETENFSVQLKPGEDLLMDLPRTEPVEVFYKSSRSFAGDAAGKNICTLVDGSLECVDAYTHRMSSVLKLEHVNLTDCGVYTIQSQTSHEVFLTYNVSVKEEQPRPVEQTCIPYWVLGLGLGLPVIVVITAVVAVCTSWKCKRKEHERIEDRKSSWPSVLVICQSSSL